MYKSLQCVVRGRVQGVCFRAWAHDQAARLGLTGWVRNLSDDIVEVLAQGDDVKLEEFKKILRQGAPLSRVEDVKFKVLDYDKSFDRFSIR